MNTNVPQQEHCCHQQTAAADAKPTDSYDHVPKHYDGTVYTCPMHPDVRDVCNSGCGI